MLRARSGRWACTLGAKRGACRGVRVQCQKSTFDKRDAMPDRQSGSCSSVVTGRLCGMYECNSGSLGLTTGYSKDTEISRL